MKKLFLVFVFLSFFAGGVVAQQKPTDNVSNSQSSQGPATDRDNNPVVDPSQNVGDLVKAEARRQDDLRAASDLLNLERGNHLKETAELRAAHEKELRVADKGEQSAIRQVDREDVAKATISSNNAISALAKQTTDLSGTLAKQTTDLSTTLAKQVQDTAIANEARQAAFSADVYKRIQGLEISASEGRGKQQVSDPQSQATLEEVRALSTRMSSYMEATNKRLDTGVGKTEGITGVFNQGNMLFISLFTAAGFIYMLVTRKRNQNGNGNGNRVSYPRPRSRRGK